MLNRRKLIGSALGATSMALLPKLHAQEAPAGSNVVVRKVSVPFDHLDPRSGTFALDVLVVGGTIDRSLPTIFIIGDGQQFYVRAAEMPRFRGIFGPTVNIVGIAGRGFAPALAAKLGSPDSPTADWEQAYRLLNDAQWTADIDAARIQLLGADKKIHIFGVSGGGYLLHAFMTQYGKAVATAYSEVAALPPIEGALNLQHDRFWAELADDQRAQLAGALVARPDRRPFYAQLLQRQNYFVTLEGLTAARSELITAIARDDQAVLRKAATDYQVDGVQRMLSTGTGWAIRVREYEFAWPVLKAGTAWKANSFRPDIEVSEFAAAPLLRLNAAGRIPPPMFDLASLNDLTAEVLIVCGRYDHISDYREQIAISGRYRNSRLLILDDDHILHNWKAIPDARKTLLRGWVAGLKTKAFEAALAPTAPLIWREA